MFRQREAQVAGIVLNRLSHRCAPESCVWIATPAPAAIRLIPKLSLFANNSQ
jgi:hypothetical protein